jgi:hypothetical protein
VNQFAQCALVGAEAICRVKTAKTGAAQTAAAFGIQREGVDKRRPAAHAEEFRGERLRIPQAFAANRDPGNLAKRLRANTAIVREEKGKKSVRSCSDC